MGGEDFRATEEDLAFLSLILSDVIWRGMHRVGSANHISLAALQRREMMLQEGTPSLVSPFQAPLLPGLLLSIRLVCAQEILCWPTGAA